MHFTNCSDKKHKSLGLHHISRDKEYSVDMEDLIQY